MIEIIPNWHPVFVHFTVALLSLTVVFHLLGRFLPDGGLKTQFNTLADWNLWLGTTFGVITAIAGWMAANSVAHDAPAHAAMMDHRNWALAALALFLALAAYSLWRVRRGARPGYIFLGVMVVAGIMLGGAAWRGAEVVYRHGIGVTSLPQVEAGEHDHASHDHSAPAAESHPMSTTPEPAAADNHDEDTHEQAASDEMHQDHAAHDHSESAADDHQMAVKPDDDETEHQNQDASEHTAPGDEHAEQEGHPQGHDDHADHVH